MYRDLTNFVPQLRRLFGLVQSENIMVILQEDLKANPKQIYDQVLAFLQLPSDHRLDFP